MKLYSSESPPAQAAESASPGAAHGLQGEGDDGRDDAETGGEGPEETPAGRQEGGGEQEPDHRETDKNQQGQDQKPQREKVQAEPVSHGSLQRLGSGNSHLFPSRGPHSVTGTCGSSTSSSGELWRERMQQPEKVLVFKDRGSPLQPGVLQEEPAACAERSLNQKSPSDNLM